MDGRKNNGGNSTKSKGIDKRKNEYRQALNEASTVEDVIAVIKMIKNKALADEDIQAAKLYLSYYLGNPKDSVDITTNGNNINDNSFDYSKLSTKTLIEIAELTNKSDKSES